MPECDLAVIKRENSPGLRIKPIRPDNSYLEARVNGGDRIIHRVERGVIYLVDVVAHDDIDKFGRRPRGG